MLKKTIIGFMLALFAVPLAAHAEMPGQPCQKEQIGTTKMADDKQNIIACLITDDGQSQKWKAFSDNKSYSLTCNDWQTAGYSSKDNCIKDGRWHLVYSNNASGGAASGSIQDLVKYVRSGADAKSISSGSLGGSHNCDALAWNNNVVACMDTLSVAGDSFASTASTNDGTYYAGSALRRTDGIRVNTNIAPSSVGGDMKMSAFMKTGGAAMDWYVRF